MTFRQKLLADIQTFVKDNKWEDHLNDIIQQIIQVKPDCPYTYLQKKMALRSKLENNKTSSCLCQLAMYCSNIDPNQNQSNIIKNKILSLYIDKYQHTKVKKSQTLQIVNFILLECSMRQKQPYLKKIIAIMDYQNNNLMNATQVAQIYYYTIVYSHMIKQINNLDDLLSREGQSISINVLKQYLHNLPQKNSLMKRFGVGECLQGNGDLYNLLTQWVTGKMKI